ncbi:MAG: serine hydrolase [Desulfovibrio sp.]|nr:serine hydrolase [Desulfovibrio sp.]
MRIRVSRAGKSDWQIRSRTYKKRPGTDNFRLPPTVGVAALSSVGKTITINNYEKYPLLSVFKFHPALAMANELAKTESSLCAPVYINKYDLSPDTYSPLRDHNPEGNSILPVAELPRYTLQLSDNNACDTLFKYIVSPSDTDKFVRSLSVADFSISRTEDDAHKNLDDCYAN